MTTYPIYSLHSPMTGPTSWHIFSTPPGLTMECPSTPHRWSSLFKLFGRCTATAKHQWWCTAGLCTAAPASCSLHVCIHAHKRTKANLGLLQGTHIHIHTMLVGLIQYVHKYYVLCCSVLEAVCTVRNECLLLRSHSKQCERGRMMSACTKSTEAHR